MRHLPYPFYERLLNAQRSLNQILTVDETLQMILKEATKLAETEGGSLFLYNPQEDHLIFYMVKGKKSRLLKGLTLAIGEGIAGCVAKTRKAELVCDAYKDPRFTNRFDTILGLKTRNLIAAPIICGKTLLGVLELLNHKKRSAFPANILKMVEEFAARAASALAATMKLQAVEADAEKWHALFEASSLHDFAHDALNRMIGQSQMIQDIKKMIHQVATSQSTVLIRGETGVGKELVAEAIHQLSSRSQQPFVCVNCGAIPAHLIESELFGHEQGSFTGAIKRRLGRFELAHQGTLFLDEIGELPLDLQVRLLRVLQNQAFERVGGTETLKVNVRVIAATNINLEEAIQEKKFRMDLFYRLNIFPITLNPLRDRKEDILPLAEHFLGKFNKIYHRSIKGFSSQVCQQFVDYLWPGNVRELENLVERAVVSCHGNEIDSVVVYPIPTKKGDSLSSVIPTDLNGETLPSSLANGITDFKRRAIQLALQQTNGNQRKAAQLLRIAPSNFLRMMRQLSIAP